MQRCCLPLSLSKEKFMELNSTGQVSSLVPEATRPNAAAKTQTAAPAGGAPESAPSAVVTDVSADVATANDRAEAAPEDSSPSVDISV